MLELKDASDLYLPEFTRLERGGGSGSGGWFLPARRAAFAQFSEVGFPTTDHEEWRYTNVSPVAGRSFRPAISAEASIDPDELATRLFRAGDGPRLVFVNGRFSKSLSRTAPLPAGVKIESLAAAFASHRAIVESHLGRHAKCDISAFTALNTALIEDGAFVHVPKGVAVTVPVEIVHVLVPGTEPIMGHPRSLLVLEESSQASVVESFVGTAGTEYFTNAVTELVVKENAVLDHYKIVRETAESFHIATTHIHQHRSSNVCSHTLTLSGGLVRNDIHAMLDGEGGDCTLNGLYVLDGDQHCDNHLLVEHAKPHCFSREFFKGILDGRSRGIFSGRIIVWKDAQKTDAKQTNRSLLLSEEAQVESKPQLEIFADDVKCTHGATIGQVSEDALFYLRSRGMTASAARGLLVHAFARESIDQVRIEPLRRHLDEWIVGRLPHGELLREAVA